MSDRISITAEPRAVVGKKVKRLRRDGWIPAVIYGRQRKPVHIKLENNSLRRVLRQVGTTQLVDIQVKGKKRTVLAREIQQHVTRGDLVHVDFMEVDMKVTVTSEASLVLTGTSQPEADGLGSVVLPLQAVTIECLPDDLVSEIDVDAGLIETPDVVLHVSNLIAPKGVTILSDPELVVARFEYVQAVEEEEEEELLEATPEDVEIIGDKGEEEEEDDEE
jgi:large subunit ribosomal protein L25